MGGSHHVTIGGGFLRRWRVMRQEVIFHPHNGHKLAYSVRYVEVARFVRASKATARAADLNLREG